MDTGTLGKVYQSDEVIVRQGDAGDYMYIIQSGQVAVVVEQDGRKTPVAVLSAGEFFGVVAIFERQAHRTTVTALGEVRVLTVDKRDLFRRIAEDPSLAFHLAERMSARIQSLTNEVARLAGDPESWRPTDALCPGSRRLDKQIESCGRLARAGNGLERRRRERARVASAQGQHG